MSKSLDLHGVRHNEVDTIVTRFIEEHREEGWGTYSIITGNSPRMRSLATDVLNQYQLEHKVNPQNCGELWYRYN